MQGNWAFVAHLKFLQLEALNGIIKLINNIVKCRNNDKMERNLFLHTTEVS
jgi:hypothetical protein